MSRRSLDLTSETATCTGIHDIVPIGECPDQVREQRRVASRVHATLQGSLGSTWAPTSSDNTVIRDAPTDAEIELALRRVSVTNWRNLTAAIDAVLAETEHGKVAGGKQVGTTIVDGQEQPVLRMPYPVYSSAVNALTEALYEVGAIVPFDWGSWIQRHPERGAHAFANPSVADAARFLTATIRGERFGDGVILEALNDGTMLGALRALRAWHRALP
jgi:hypothetical protein